MALSSWHSHSDSVSCPFNQCIEQRQEDSDPTPSLVRRSGRLLSSRAPCCCVNCNGRLDCDLTFLLAICVGPAGDHSAGAAAPSRVIVTARNRCASGAMQTPRACEVVVNSTSRRHTIHCTCVNTEQRLYISAAEMLLSSVVRLNDSSRHSRKWLYHDRKSWWIDGMVTVRYFSEVLSSAAAPYVSIFLSFFPKTFICQANVVCIL